MRHNWWAAIVLFGVCGCAARAKVAPSPKTSAAPAQAVIRGMVVGPAGEKLDRVEVSTVPETDIVLTRAGLFEIKRHVDTGAPVSPGRYRLQVRLDGYVLDGDAARLDIDFRGGELNLESIRLRALREGGVGEQLRPTDKDFAPEGGGNAYDGT